MRGSDNGDATVGAVRLDGAVGRLVWHVDGFGRDAGNYDIPRYAESARLREAEHEEEDHHEDEHGDGDHDDDHEDGDEHGHEQEEAHGNLPGSDYDVRGGALGFSFIGDRAFAGISFSRMNGDYGLPGHAHDHHEHGADHDEHGAGHEDDDHADEHEEEAHDDEAEHGDEGNAWLDMEQRRIDVELGLLDPFANFERLTVRASHNDYEHVETEPNGLVGTLFANKAYDARIELSQRTARAWRSAYGLHFGGREFSAIGERLSCRQWIPTQPGSSGPESGASTLGSWRAACASSA